MYKTRRTECVIRLEGLRGSHTLCGLARLIMCIAEVPFFYLSGALIRLLGARGVIALAQLAYLVRFIYYSVSPNARCYRTVHGNIFRLPHLMRICCTPQKRLKQRGQAVRGSNSLRFWDDLCFLFWGANLSSWSATKHETCGRRHVCCIAPSCFVQLVRMAFIAARRLFFVHVQRARTR